MLRSDLRKPLLLGNPAALFPCGRTRLNPTAIVNPTEEFGESSRDSRKHHACFGNSLG